MKKPIKPTFKKPEKTSHKFFYMYRGYSDNDIKLFEDYENEHYDDYSVHNSDIRLSEINTAVNELAKTFNIVPDKIKISLIEDHYYPIMEFHVVLEKSDEEFNKELKEFDEKYSNALEEYNKSVQSYKAYTKAKKIQDLKLELEKLQKV